MNEKNLKPEESQSGFKFGDEGNDFFRKASPKENPQEHIAEESAAQTGNKRIVIDTNESKGSFTPQKRSSRRNWVISFFVIAILLAAGTYFIWDKFINNPIYLDKVENIKKEIQIIDFDDSEDKTESNINLDVDFNPDSIINTVLLKSKGQKEYTETIKRKVGDNTQLLQIYKNNNIITLETDILSPDNKQLKHFIRQIVVEENDITSKEGKVTTEPSNEPNYKEQTKPNAAESQTEKKMAVQPIPKTEAKSQITENSNIKSSNSKTEKSFQKDSEIKKTKESDKNGQTYSFESKFGKKIEEKPKTDIGSTTQTPSQEKQYSSEGPIYTIQVYSSPSLEDAKYWVKRLQQMNISSVYISKQKVRETVWYRVRFGEYSSKEEAKSAASGYGFGQLWIDRVK